MINELTSTEQFFEILQTSKQRPVCLFKHSTACGTSAGAWRDFQRFAESEPRPEYWRVLAIEQRALAKFIAQHTTVRHESPQVLLFHEGKVLWHASHWNITAQALQKALETIPVRVA